MVHTIVCANDSQHTRAQIEHFWLLYSSVCLSPFSEWDSDIAHGDSGGGGNVEISNLSNALTWNQLRSRFGLVFLNKKQQYEEDAGLCRGKTFLREKTYVLTCFFMQNVGTEIEGSLAISTGGGSGFVPKSTRRKTKPISQNNVSSHSYKFLSLFLSSFH